ncbi:hypothetical protein EDD18DRAFT_1434628 [Armillaria luteobubalina]|uniref:Uncharacterized protein n=1 Tax=Armillaria luteobubalina TaxID=153913 RepID=A0AA39QF58_9AGAR|nr:hypothetical protein EDD18DRAFT_1434628 [Armillaria luteobubalina]
MTCPQVNMWPCGRLTNPLSTQDYSSPLQHQINNEFTAVQVPAVSRGEGEPCSPSHLCGVFSSVSSPEEHTSERACAQAVNAAIQGVASELIPNFQFVPGNEYKDPNGTTDTVNDEFMYVSNVDTSSSPTQRDKAVLWVEIKRDSSHCSFKDDKDDGWVPQTKSSQDIRVQLTRHASETLNTQHNQHILSFPGSRWCPVLEMGEERTYAAVSVAFDLATEGEYVIELFYRLCTLTDRDRGKDDTATPSTEDEITLAKKSLKSWIHSTDKPRAFVTIHVHRPTGDKEVIYGPHIVTSRSVTS